MNQQDNGSRVAALVLIGLGVLFLLAQVFNFSIFGTLWPFFVIIPGAAFLYFAGQGDKNQSGLAIPGAIITGTGVILLYQNVTGHWESWAYAWLLYPVFLGMALQYMGRRSGDQGAYQSGRGLVRWGGIAFIAGAVLFELVIFGRGGFLGSFALPLLLIGVGVLLLLRRETGGKGKAKNDDAPLFTGARVVGAAGKSNGVINPDLERKISEALAEDEPDSDEPKNV
ncbi:MAG: hypothetical protein HXY41_09270 [Chloroflexi bacterium]|nr:hypothetical protein [Chloroflexota bacterium]